MSTRERSLSPSRKQLVARRGSISAPDPHGNWPTRPSQNGQSRLTIVRATPVKENIEGVPSLGRRGSLTRRNNNGSTLSRSNSHRSESPSRLSFASATFTPPGTAPRSPTFGHHRRSSSADSTKSISAYQPRLNPIEVRDLAREAALAPAPFGSGLNSFSVMAEDVFLPFVDRPVEVTVLISNGPCAKLMTLLEHALGRDESNKDGSSGEGTSTWSFEQLVHWLTKVNRDVASDMVWIKSLRQAIRPHSELLWERVKGMLGVPPELESPGHDQGAVNAPGSLGRKLFFEPIRTCPLSPTSELGNIAEDAEASNLETSTPIDTIHGLRVSTPRFFSTPGAIALKAPVPRRAGSHNVVPTRSSPLVPRAKTASPAILALKEDTEPPLREKGKPLFPSNFSKLQPTRAIAPAIAV